MSTNEEIASRFAPYLKELHELFALHGVRFGSPADLSAVVERLGEGGYFAQDVSSILRSIILREGGSLPQTELLEVLALAVAGPELDPTLPEMQPAFRRLLSFVGTIASRPWNVPPGDPPPAPEAAEDAPAAPVARPAQQEQPAPVQTLNAARERVAQNGAGLAAESLGDSAPATPPATFRPYAPRHQAEEQDSYSAEGIPPPKPHSGRNPSWPLWIAAGCAILAVLLLVLFDRNHPQQEATVVPVASSATAAAPGANPATAQPSKPTAAVSSAAGRRPPLQASSQGTWQGSSQNSQTSRTHASSRSPQAAAGQLANGAGAAYSSPGNQGQPYTRTQPGVQTYGQVQGQASGQGARQATGLTPRQTAGPTQPQTAGQSQGAIQSGAQTQAQSGRLETRPGQPEGSGSAGVETRRAAPAPIQRSAADIPAVMRSPALALPREHNGRGGYFQVSSAVMASHLVHATEPGYPMIARLAHVEGQVILQAVISTDGEVVATHALSGHRLLRAAAASAVKQWRYRPFLVDGHPVNVATIVTVDFRDHH